ncbi:MAG: virulence factor [Porticoccaceae bacterium]|nr:virulence factor [Porticoccaceae bacterium]
MQKILVYWRDIPAQVLVKRGRDRGKAILSQRFQEAIDRAAMRAGKGGSDEYLADWRRESSALEAEGSPQVLAEQIAAEIEREYSDQDIKKLVKAKGLKVG